MNTSIRLTIILLFAAHTCTAQSYFDNRFITETAVSGEQTFTFYVFSRAGAIMKAKHFVRKNGRSPYDQYLAWKGKREILLVTSGAFCDHERDIVGLCVDNGETVNATADPDMDGMVIIFGSGEKEGGIAVIDMDYKPVTVTDSGRTRNFYPRSSFSDRYKFLDWGKRSGVTLFQSQLLYSPDHPIDTGNLDFAGIIGRRKVERRLLAQCKKNNVLYNIIVDAPSGQYLNRAAYNAKNALESKGYTVAFIINLDTGGNNILHVYNGSSLQDIHPVYDATIGTVPTLLVYYKD